MAQKPEKYTVRYRCYFCKLRFAILFTVGVPALDWIVCPRCQNHTAERQGTVK